MGSLEPTIYRSLTTTRPEADAGGTAAQVRRRPAARARLAPHSPIPTLAGFVTVTKAAGFLRTIIGQRGR